MGNVDLASLPWSLFWVGIAYFLVTGVFFCLGFMRLLSQRIRSGIIFMVIAVISGGLFLNYLFTHHI
ncbi:MULTISPECIES: hypothetical protein [Brevibacillus]|uniref:hypothetical protein n=1 Tax=Brevibacillus TaxID=55080 RepID=UPI000A498B4B|nr:MULTISPECIES: hypothetical protein [Brevibacillus]MDR7317549.1 hypothetical protein [Brevibacillus nitrificans]MED1795329.1 hypothetical protein [Brevibacillus nitrificans]MED1949876.1 hypothetical protein [Brevibacillus centrosporus]RNB64914.1 hypothetical protein EDM55_26610 [Brevibacillus centrosporus]GED31230.1 hypothetical protein BCE02nite_23710 [Brevibacillus centrosporus]